MVRAHVSVLPLSPRQLEQYLVFQLRKHSKGRNGFYNKPIMNKSFSHQLILVAPLIHNSHTHTWYARSMHNDDLFAVLRKYWLLSLSFGLICVSLSATLPYFQAFSGLLFEFSLPVAPGPLPLSPLNRHSVLMIPFQRYRRSFSHLQMWMQGDNYRFRWKKIR